MKAVVILLIALTAVFFWQHRHDNSTAAAAPASAPQSQPATPRPVYEHDWAKHSIDRARAVTEQVKKVRDENEQP